MCDLVSGWVGVTIGGALQMSGVILLMIGIVDTRRAFDPEWEGLTQATRERAVAAAGAAFGRVGSMWRRLIRKPRIVHGEAHLSISHEVTASGGGRGYIKPSWDHLEPMDAIQTVHDLLYKERDRLLDRLGEETAERDRLLETEREARVEQHERLRTDLGQLALGGLAKEGWAAVLIILGVVVTTIASICS